MSPDDIKAGEWYLAAVGNWIYDVVSIDDGVVTYKILQKPGQEFRCHVASLAGRCQRRLP